MTTPPHEIVAKDYGTEKMDLRHRSPHIEAHIVELLHKIDGQIDDQPSFAIVSQIIGQGYVYQQITLNTLNHALNKIGYEIRKG